MGDSFVDDLKNAVVQIRAKGLMPQKDILYFLEQSIIELEEIHKYLNECEVWKRDEFAGQALNALIINSFGESKSEKELSDKSYMYANAMMKARKIKLND